MGGCPGGCRVCADPLIWSLMWILFKGFIATGHICQHVLFVLFVFVHLFILYWIIISYHIGS